jgi:hypothetical protein
MSSNSNNIPVLHRCARILKVMLMSTICFAASANALTSSQESRQPSRFERFKAFIEHPPLIENLSFSYAGPSVSLLDSKSKQWIKQPSPPSFIRTTWSSDDFITVTSPSLQFRDGEGSASSSEEFANSAILAHLNGGFWSYIGPQRRLTFWAGPIQFPLDLANPVVVDYHREMLPVFALLNMGPHLIPPGSIRWQGNRFAYTSTMLTVPISIEGELSQDADGLPCQMTLRYVGPHVDGRFTVKYQYGDLQTSHLPPFIPQRIDCVLQKGGESIPNKSFQLFSLTLPTDRQIINPSLSGDVIKSWHPHQFIYTNGSLYSIEEGGHLRLVPRRTEPERPRMPIVHANRYYYTACAAWSLTFISIYFRGKPKLNFKHKPQTTKEIIA